MHTLENDVLKVVVSEHGAELQSIYHKGNEREYLWQGDETCWGRRSPILFPVVGKLANNTYYVKGRDYHLSRHGFARDLDFEVMEKQDDYIKLLLKANERTMLMFPYNFHLTVSYKLEGNHVKINSKVYNHSDELMYFSIGAHPAFNTNLSENGIEDYYLEFNEPKTLKTKVFDKEVGLLTHEEKPLIDNQKQIDLKYSLFEQDALIFENIHDIVLKNRVNNQEVRIQCPEFPLLGIWTSKANTKCPFISIEPWYGVADYAGSPTELRSKPYIQSVYPDDKFVACYTIEIR